MNNRIYTVTLDCRKRKKGNSYRLRYRLPGNTVYSYEYLGNISKYQAELIRSQKQADIIAGRFNLPRNDEQRISLQQLVDEYFATRIDLHPNTLKRYRSNTTRLINFFSEYFPQAFNDIRNIRTEYIRELISRARQKEFYLDTWSDKSCNGARAVFQMVFDYAVKRRYLSENPVSEIRQFRIPENTAGKAIPNYDLRDIFKKLPKHWIDAFKFLLNTGLRNGELINLTWSNFHQTGRGRGRLNYITVTSSEEFTTKTRKSRNIPLNKDALAILKRREGKHTRYIFTTSFNEKIADGRLRKVLNEAQENSSYHYRVHDFRHTFGSKLAQQNVSLYKISILMGHTILETTRLYAHLQSGDLQDAVNLISY